MATTIDETVTVRDLVVHHPELRQVLESLGVDYCCGGDNPLADAVAKAGLDLHTVVSALKEAVESKAAAHNSPERDWSTATLTGLADYIEDRHHVYTKEALPRLDDLFTKVLRAHGKNHGDMLRMLQTVFEGLRSEIEMHLQKEEQVLFPYIREMESSLKQTGRVPPMHCGTVQNPIRQMKAEHENAGETLARMRSATDDYALPADACPTFGALFEGLRELEADLHEHIHLENNILFPRAEAMETQGQLKAP
jgi:regulator of cell morphogenesis and NO signaling